MSTTARRLDASERAGFEPQARRENTAYRFVSERAARATRRYGVTSRSLLVRPVAAEG